MFSFLDVALPIGKPYVYICVFIFGFALPTWRPYVYIYVFIFGFCFANLQAICVYIYVFIFGFCFANLEAICAYVCGKGGGVGGAVGGEAALPWRHQRGKTRICSKMKTMRCEHAPTSTW